MRSADFSFSDAAPPRHQTNLHFRFAGLGALPDHESGFSYHVLATGSWASVIQSVQAPIYFQGFLKPAMKFHLHRPDAVLQWQPSHYSGREFDLAVGLPDSGKTARGSKNDGLFKGKNRFSGNFREKCSLRRKPIRCNRLLAGLALGRSRGAGAVDQSSSLKHLSYVERRCLDSEHCRAFKAVSLSHFWTQLVPPHPERGQPARHCHLRGQSTLV